MKFDDIELELDDEWIYELKNCNFNQWIFDMMTLSMLYVIYTLYI